MYQRVFVDRLINVWNWSSQELPLLMDRSNAVKDEKSAVYCKFFIPDWLLSHRSTHKFREIFIWNVQRNFSDVFSIKTFAKICIFNSKRWLCDVLLPASQRRHEVFVIALDYDRRRSVHCTGANLISTGLENMYVYTVDILHAQGHSGVFLVGVKTYIPSEIG